MWYLQKKQKIFTEVSPPEFDSVPTYSLVQWEIQGYVVLNRTKKKEDFESGLKFGERDFESQIWKKRHWVLKKIFEGDFESRIFERDLESRIWGKKDFG